MKKKILYIIYFVCAVSIPTVIGTYFGVEPIWYFLVALFLVFIPGYKPEFKKNQPKQKRNANPLIRMLQTNDDIFED